MNYSLSTLFHCAPQTEHLVQITPHLDLPFPHPDLHLLNTQEEAITIEDVRHALADMAMSPYQSPQSVFVIFNIEQASIAAQNALLKALEEPPAHVRLLLTTAQPSAVLPTILSRCELIRIATTEVVEQQDFSAVLTKIHTGTFQDIFALSEEYQDRSAAQELVQGLIQWVHRELEKNPHPRFTQALHHLLVAEEQLNKNVNVRLVLEECFFSLKKLS